MINVAKKKKVRADKWASEQETSMEIDDDVDVRSKYRLSKDFSTMEDLESVMQPEENEQNQKQASEKSFSEQAEMEKNMEADDDIMLSESSELRKNSLSINHGEIANSNNAPSISQTKCKKNYVGEVCQFLLRNYEMVSDMNFRSINVYYPEPGVYQKKTLMDFKLFVRESCRERNIKAEQTLTSFMLKEIFDRLLTEPSIQIKNKTFQDISRLLNFRNGIVNIVTREFLEHSPKYFFLDVIPLNYELDEGLDMPCFNTLLSTTCSTKEDQKLLMEIFSYAVSNFHCAKNLFVFIGRPHTGKSMWLKLMEMYVGSATTCHVPPHDFSNRFNKSLFSRARLNTVGEIEGKEICNTAVLKSIVAAEPIMAEFKGKDPFQFVPLVNCVFATNAMLDVKAALREDALYERFIFIEFNTQISKENWVPDYEKIVFEREGAAIAKRIVETLHILYENNFQFTLSFRSKSLKKEFVCGNDPVRNFLDDQCIIATSYRISSRDITDACKKYCLDNAFTMPSGIALSLGIQRITGIKKKKIRIQKKTLQGYMGIGLKHNE